MPGSVDWLKDQLKKGEKEDLKTFFAKKKFSKKAPVKGVPKKKSSFMLPEWSYRASMVIVVLVLLAAAFWLANMFLLKDSCSKFKSDGYKKSCREASAVVLADSPGKVKDVLIGKLSVPIFSGNGVVAVEKEAWLFDVELAEPYFNENSKKEIGVLRIGVGLDEDIGIHRRVMQ